MYFIRIVFYILVFQYNSPNLKTFKSNLHDEYINLPKLYVFLKYFLGFIFTLVILIDELLRSLFLGDLPRMGSRTLLWIILMALCFHSFFLVFAGAAIKL